MHSFRHFYPFVVLLLFVICPSHAESNNREYNISNILLNMVGIPAGSFKMGSNEGDVDEKPVHTVNINAFYMSESEVTFELWDACVSSGGCSYKPDDWDGRGNYPVIHISYNDIIEQFIPWLNKVTGKVFRLPSESEWEYAARARSSALYSWGDSDENAQCDDCKDTIELWEPAPVRSFKANDFGLFDMHANVWEWTQDCWHDNYQGAPDNGAVWSKNNCTHRVARGGSYLLSAHYMRSTNRVKVKEDVQYRGLGFRLAQD